MQRQSGNPRGTVGDGRSNNNNTKSNLNYALKRLGQNNPQNKHKRGVGEGEGARDRSCSLVGHRVRQKAALGSLEIACETRTKS